MERRCHGGTKSQRDAGATTRPERHTYWRNAIEQSSSYRGEKWSATVTAADRAELKSALLARGMIALRRNR